MRSSLAALLEEFTGLWKCFPVHECNELREVLRLLPELEEKASTDIEDCFRQAARSLPLVAAGIQACPSVLGQQRLGGRERSTESLIDALCQSEEISIEFLMPTGAVLGRAFVLAKFNFLKALSYLLEAAGSQAAPSAARVREFVSDTMFSKLAEELLTGAISNHANPMDLKRAAAQRLIGMWNDRLQLPIGEFPPVLLSAWRARCKVRATFGTLLGVNEVFSLIQAECGSHFVNYFVREHVTADEREAFQEFLFGLSFEELKQLNTYMEEHHLSVITPAQVREVLTNPVHRPIFGDPSPEQIYNSYRRRRIRAEYRALSGSPGPRKTAEGYIMETLLREGAR